jgi:DNA-binding MarR family transcriptional regulator
MSNAGSARPTAEPRISYVVARLERALRRNINQRVRGYGLTTLQYTLLSVLRSSSRLSNAQLARRAYMTPQAINEVLRALEEKGLVCRSADPRHGLIRPASLTEEGHRVVALCDRAVDEMEEEMLSDLDGPSRERLLEWLKVCVRSFHAGFPQADS